MFTAGLCAMACAAWAYYGSMGTGAAAATSGTLGAPTAVTATAPLNSSIVAVSWSASSLATGQAAQGYYVNRIRDSDGFTAAACGTSSTTPTTASSCNDTGVVDGRYHYRVTATYETWTAVSTSSASLTVVNDTSKPTINVTAVSPTPNGNQLNNTSPVTVTLTASSGTSIAFIRYTVDSGSAVTVNADTATVSVSGNGQHTLSFFARDSLNQDSATGTDIVTIDTIAPAAPPAPTLAAASDSGSSSTDRITTVTTPTLAGTAESGALVTLYDGSTAVGSATATGGSYSITASTLSQAAHTLTVKATDLAGNTGASSSSTVVTIDTTAPTAPATPLLTAASDSGSSSSDNLTNVTTPTFTGTVETSASVTLYDATTAVGTASSTAGSYSVTSSARVAGSHGFTVKATDVAGNTGASSAGTTVTIDTTAPSNPGTMVLAAASDTGRSSTDRNTSVTTPTFTGTITAGTTLTVYDGTTALGSQAAPSTPYTYVSPTLANGTHPMTAKAADAAGNLSAASTAISVVVDTVAPAAPSAPVLSAGSDSGRSPSDRITNVTTPLITGTNESKAIVKLYDATTLLGTVTTAGTSSSITSTTLAEGVHGLTATSTDVAGNTGVSSASTSITIDLTAPVAPSAPVLNAASETGISATDGITKLTKPVLTGTAEDNITVALYEGATASGASVIVSGGSYAATTATLANGAHTFTARPTDAAGNAGPSSAASSTVTVDATAPTVTMNQAAGQADPTTGTSIGFTATFSEPVYGLTTTGIALSGTALPATKSLSGGPTTYATQVGGMTKSGTVVAKVSVSAATDAAGNANAASTATDGTVTYTDSVAPTVSISSLVVNAGRTVTVSGTGGLTPGDNTTVTVVLCSVNIYPCLAANTKATLTATVTAGTGAWTVTSANLGIQPTLYARATQTDLAGNTGTSAVAGPVTVP